MPDEYHFYSNLVEIKEKRALRDCLCGKAANCRKKFLTYKHIRICDNCKVVLNRSASDLSGAVAQLKKQDRTAKKAGAK